MVSPIPMMLLFGSWAYPALRPPRRFGQHEVSSHMVSFFSFPLSPTFVIFLSPGCVFADDVPLFFFFFDAWFRSTCPMFFSFVFYVRGAGGSFFSFVSLITSSGSTVRSRGTYGWFPLALVFFSAPLGCLAWTWFHSRWCGWFGCAALGSVRPCGLRIFPWHGVFHGFHVSCFDHPHASSSSFSRVWRTAPWLRQVGGSTTLWSAVHHDRRRIPHTNDVVVWSSSLFHTPPPRLGVDGPYHLLEERGLAVR